MKKFTSTNGWFTMELPDNWEEYDAEEEGTYAFFNVKKWTGNFRVTPLRYSGKESTEENESLKFLEDLSKKNPGARKVKLGELHWIHYKKELEEETGDLVMYNWAANKTNILFLCSFTVNKTADQTERNKIELEVVENIIKSIRSVN